MSERAWLVTESWAGRSWWRVQVLSKGPKRARIRTLRKTLLPGRRRWVDGGYECSVPTYALSFGAPRGTDSE